MRLERSKSLLPQKQGELYTKPSEWVVVHFPMGLVYLGFIRVIRTFVKKMRSKPDSKQHHFIYESATMVDKIF
jgi:hypothetical protein